MNIAIIGMMGTGKSHVGSLLAKKLSYELIDIDTIVEKSERKKIADIFAECGEEYFRSCETRTLEKAVSGEGAVISCGGGIVTRARNVELLEKCFTIRLVAKAETIYNRVTSNANRPLLKNNLTVQGIATILQRREEKYSKASKLDIVTDDKNVTEVVEEIFDKLKERNIV